MKCTTYLVHLNNNSEDLLIDTFEDLFTHPCFGSSWESVAIENILHNFPRYEASFYRTSNGSEIDFLLIKGQKKIGIEFKTSSTPKVTPGFWHCIDDLNNLNMVSIIE